MENPEITDPQVESPKVEGKETEGKPFKTFETESEFDSAVDERVSKALETAKTGWKKETEAQVDKAKKLAAMSEEERKNSEFTEREQQLADREAELNRKQYTFEAKSQLEKKGLSTDLVDLVMADDPEETNKRIGLVNDVIESAVKKKVEELSNTGAPLGSQSPLGSDSLAEAMRKKL